jgi:hypothetical protein
MGGVTTGVLILICLAFFMPYCAFIPKVRSQAQRKTPTCVFVVGMKVKI